MSFFLSLRNRGEHLQFGEQAVSQTSPGGRLTWCSRLGLAPWKANWTSSALPTLCFGDYGSVQASEHQRSCHRHCNSSANHSLIPSLQHDWKHMLWSPHYVRSPRSEMSSERAKNLDPHYGNPLCTWALSELPRRTLAEERSPAGFVTDTLHVPWTRLLHARIIGPRAQSSCDKGGTRMISTKGITPHSRSTGTCKSWTPQAARSRSARMGFPWCVCPSNVPVSAKSSLSDASMLGSKSKWDSVEAKIC